MPKLYLSPTALVENYRHLKTQTEGEIIPVLKADAYGHGARFALSHLLDEGASTFAVACATEALELLEFIEKSKYSFTKTRVFVMGEVEEDALPFLLSPRIILSVHSPTYAKRLSRAVERRKGRLLLPERFSLAVHLKLETGMQRLGLRTEESIKAILSLSHLSVTGAYSHLAHAASRERTEAQANRFLSLLGALPTPITTHLAASEGLLRYGDLSHTAVRTGLSLYGVAPKGVALPLTPVMRFSVRVLSVFRAARDSYVGYGSTRTDRERRLAVFDAGYADGIPPHAGEGGRVMIKGRVCPLFGEVCMDRFTAEVGDLPLREGEEISLFGRGACDTRLAAEMLGVSPYALLSVRSARTCRTVEEA